MNVSERVNLLACKYKNIMEWKQKWREVEMSWRSLDRSLTSPLGVWWNSCSILDVQIAPWGTSIRGGGVSWVKKWEITVSLSLMLHIIVTQWYKARGIYKLIEMQYIEKIQFLLNYLLRINIFFKICSIKKKSGRLHARGCQLRPDHEDVNLER